MAGIPERKFRGLVQECPVIIPVVPVT